tara:strand:+ start:246 stop:422 length:177 start_codon:yes stop_codon:yes gene_type:complete
MLKEILKSKGIKQNYIAQRVGVSVVTVSNWVKEKSSPSKKHLDKLCEILDVTIKDIVN